MPAPNDRPGLIGLDSYINEGVVFELLRDMVPSNPDSPFLSTGIMQDIRDRWHARYEALFEPYSNEELAEMVRAHAYEMPDELVKRANDVAGIGDPTKSADFESAVGQALDGIGIHIQSGVERNREREAMADLIEANPFLARSGNGAASSKALIALESVLREGDVIDRIGEHHVIADASQPAMIRPVRDESGRPTRDAILDDGNIQGFIDVYRRMREHVEGRFDVDITDSKNQAVHKRSHMVPISPLDPAFCDRACTYDSGAAQLMFAAVPFATDGDKTYTESLHTLEARGIDAWREDYTGDAMRVPVAVSYLDEDGRPAYIGAGHTDVENHKTLRYNARLSTLSDAIGLSNLRFAMTDDANYRDVADGVLAAWSGYRGEVDAIRFANHANMHRHMVETVSVPMADHLARRGGELTFVADRFPGQLVVLDANSKLTVRVTERPESDAFELRRWVGKVRTRSADDYEFQVRDAHTGESLIGGASRGISDAEALSLYTPEVRMRELDFLLGVTFDDELRRELRGAGSTYPASYRLKGKSMRTFVVSRSKTGNSGCNVETPLARTRVTVNGKARDAVIVLKSGVSRKQDPDMYAPSAQRFERHAKADIPLLKYEKGTGRPYFQDGDGRYLDANRDVVDEPVYGPVTYEDMLRYAVQAAQDNITEMLDVEGLIASAQTYLLAPDAETARSLRPSFDRDGELTDGFVIDARMGMWRVLTGQATSLEKPWLVTDAELEADASMLFEPEKLVDATYEDEANASEFDQVMNARAEYVRDYVDAVRERRIGGFDADAERGGRFNPANVLAYANGFEGGMGTQRLVALMRNCGIAGDELLGEGAKGGRDAFALRIADRVDPFHTEAAQTLADLSGDESELGRYKAHVLETVREAASAWSARELTDTDVAIDDAGLVRYTFAHAPQVTAESRGSAGDSPEQREYEDGTLNRTTGYIGRFALPERTHAGALRSQGRFADEKIYHTQAHAFILPQDDEHDRTDRTRAVTFDDAMRAYVFDQVAYDVRTAYANPVAEVGDFDSMRGLYQADDTSFVMGAERYDREWEQALKSDGELERFSAEGLYNLAHIDELPRFAHGEAAPKTAEALLARERTAMAEVNYGNSMLAADVRGQVREAAGRGAKVSSRYRDPMTLADGRPLAVMTEHDAQVFDMYQVPDNAKQTTKRHLNVGASLSRDAAPVFDAEHTSCAIGELPQFANKAHDVWNRVRMGQANEMQELGHDPAARVVMAGGGGFTQNDGMIATREWCMRHGVVAGDGSFRSLTVGDKISDDHGNKGVISMVLDVNDTPEEASAKGSSYKRWWDIAQANSIVKRVSVPIDPERPELGCELIDLRTCNFDVVMNSVSFMSRLNGATLVDAMESEHDVLHVPDGEDVEAGIFRTNISIHDQLVDKGSHDHDSHAGWQLATAIMDRCPNLMFEMYGDNVNGWKRLREALNVSVGYDFTPDGTIIEGVDTTDGNARRELDYERVYIANEQTVGEVAAGLAPGSDPVRVQAPRQLRQNDTVMSARYAIDTAGGTLAVPFELTYPKRRLSARDISPDAAERMGLEPGEDAVIGGGTLPVASRVTSTGAPMYALPVESAPGRASLESRGRQQRHDHMRQYAAIVRAAVRYENALNLERAFADERDRIVAGIRAYEANPGAEGAVNPDEPITAFYTGALKDTPDPKNAENRMTWRQIACAYTATVEGPAAARELLSALDGTETDRARLKTSLSDRMERDTFAAKRREYQAEAQSAFTSMSDEVWQRNFTGSANNVKNLLMRSTIRDSAYMVWTANPALDVDTVAISPAVAEKLGVHVEDGIGGADKRVALWRSPVLRSMNIAAFRFTIDPDIKGVAVNPAVTTRISGDFDGDHVSLYFPKDAATQAEIARELSFARHLVDDHIEPERDVYTIERGGRQVSIPKYELGIDIGLDSQLGRQFDDGADRLLSDGQEQASIAWYDWHEYEKWAQTVNERCDELEGASETMWHGSLSNENGQKIKGAYTVGQVRKAVRERGEECLRIRDAACEAAFEKLNRGIKCAEAASVGHGVIDFSDDARFLGSVYEATVKHGVKGKFSQLNHLMSRMGFVPNEPKLISAIAKMPEGSRANVGDASYGSLAEYIRDYGRIRVEDAFVDGEARFSQVPNELFCRLDDLDVSDEVKQAVCEATDEVRFAEDQSTSLAMNAKTTITAVVGVLPQHGHKAIDGDHTLVADVTEPMYQMSLDFKLDGEDALRKIPWVDVWVSTLRRGQLYEELLRPDAVDGGIELDPTKLTPCRMATGDAVRDDNEVFLTSDNLKTTLKNIYAACGQSLAEEKIDAFVEAMSEPREITDANGTRTVRVARPLDEIAAEQGSMLMRIGFDSSKTGATMIEAARTGAQIFDSEKSDVNMACGYVRDALGAGVEGRRGAKYAHGGAERSLDRSVRVADVEAPIMNTRGLDAARAAKSANGTGARVAVFKPQGLMLDEVALGIVNRNINMAIDPVYRRYEGDQFNVPIFDVVEVEPSQRGSAIAAVRSKVNQADLVVVLGEGRTESMGVAVMRDGIASAEDFSTVDVVEHASRQQTAVLEMDVANIMPERRAELEAAGRGDAIAPATSLYRFDRGERLGQYLGSDPEVTNKSWLDACREGDYKVAIIGARPEEGLVCDAEHTSVRDMRWDHGDKERVAAYEELVGLTQHMIEKQLGNMDTQRGDTAGVLTVVTDGERGAGCLAAEAALRAAKHTNGRVRLELDCAFSDQEKRYEQADASASAKSEHGRNYFGSERFESIRRAADVVRPADAACVTRGRKLNATAEREQVAEVRERIVAKSNLVIALANDDAPKSAAAELDRALDYAREKGKLLLRVNTDPAVKGAAKARRDEVGSTKYDAQPTTNRVVDMREPAAEVAARAEAQMLRERERVEAEALVAARAQVAGAAPEASADASEDRAEARVDAPAQGVSEPVPPAEVDGPGHDGGDIEMGA